MTPTCPHHNREMRPGKNGGWFCPTKNPDGNWCKYRPGKELTSSGGASLPAGSAQPTATQNTRYLVVVAALDFASRVHQGTGDAASAIETARAVLAAFEGEV